MYSATTKIFRLCVQGKIKVTGEGAVLPERDPSIVATAFKRQRFYLFTRREPADADDAAVSDEGHLHV